MNWPWQSSNATLAAQLAASEQRCERLQSELTEERRENRRAERHWASQFLRREKLYPLPPTIVEEAAQQAKVEARQNQPPTLNADQLARREAVRAWAKTNGLTQDEADKAFMSQLAMQVDDE